MSWTNKPPVPTDGWGTALPKLHGDGVNDDTEAVQARINNGWQKGDPGYSDAYYPLHDNERIEELREAIWTANALDSANVKAGVVNALSGNKDHFNIDQDGELTRLQEITKSVSPGPHGYYIAYHNGRWLHAILSGPYESKDAAMLQAPKAYDMMTNDAAFKLAFENKFDRNGIYCAEIPLSAKRHGAYGVIE
jgi:hypothetical protein